MGKLIKNHWARLIILTAATCTSPSSPSPPLSSHPSLTPSSPPDQIAASISGFFWPKLFWDFLTTNLDHCVRPVPYLQILNLLFGILGLCWEWPLPLFTSASNILTTTTTTTTTATSKPTYNTHKPTASTLSSTSSSMAKPPPPPRSRTFLAHMHRSISARLLVYPLNALAALLLYQGTNAGLYYIIGMGVYFWAFSEGEVVMGTPWSLPKKKSGRRGDGRV
ncbi:hypothetical protein ACLMJK_008436 [Lecanora helva]